MVHWWWLMVVFVMGFTVGGVIMFHLRGTIDRTEGPP